MTEFRMGVFFTTVALLLGALIHFIQMPVEPQAKTKTINFSDFASPTKTDFSLLRCSAKTIIIAEDIGDAQRHNLYDECPVGAEKRVEAEKERVEADQRPQEKSLNDGTLIGKTITSTLVPPMSDDELAEMKRVATDRRVNQAARSKWLWDTYAPVPFPLPEGNPKVTVIERIPGIGDFRSWNSKEFSASEIK